jgi:hypothetical protein
LHFVEKFGTRLLEKLAVRVIILVGNIVLLHDIVVEQLG